MKQLLKQFNLIHGKSSPKPEFPKATKSEQGQDELIILKKYALYLNLSGQPNLQEPT
jgi:hypothetical protein